jgi:hypothetical protein
MDCHLNVYKTCMYTCYVYATTYKWSRCILSNSAQRDVTCRRGCSTPNALANIGIRYCTSFIVSSFWSVYSNEAFGRKHFWYDAKSKQILSVYISFSNVQFACKYCGMQSCKREQKYISWRTASKKAIDFQVIVYSYII